MVKQFTLHKWPKPQKEKVSSNEKLLMTVVAQQKITIQRLREHIAQLEAKIQQLESQIIP